MTPKAPQPTREQPLWGWTLEAVLDPRQELYRLAGAIDWASLEREFGPLYCPDNGRPGVPIRLMAGLHLLKHTFGLSDEDVVAHWVLNPYYQFFCGEEFFQHELPISPSQMSRWRKRIGEAGCQKLLALTIEAGKRTGTVSERSFEKVIVDTTVQPKAVAHPTVTRLFYKALTIHHHNVAINAPDAVRHGLFTVRAQRRFEFVKPAVLDLDREVSCLRVPRDQRRRAVFRVHLEAVFWFRTSFRLLPWRNH